MSTKDTRRILLINTGGTMDAEAYTDTPPIITPHEPSLVKTTVIELQGGSKVDFYPYPRKDSKEFTQHDIAELAYIIRNEGHELFIIVHGTDAMVQNALNLQEQLQGQAKTVFFVGAMEPLSHGPERSDGYANLAYTLKNIRKSTYQHNVWIVGRSLSRGVHKPSIFAPETAEKDYVKKIFRRREVQG